MEIYIILCTNEILLEIGRLDLRRDTDLNLNVHNEIVLGPDDGPAHRAVIVHCHAAYKAAVAEDVATDQLHSEDPWAAKN